MRKRYWLMGALAVVLMLAAMVPAVVLAKGPSDFVASVDTLTVTPTPLNNIKIRQTGAGI